MELASCQPSDARVFRLLPDFLKNCATLYYTFF